MTAKNTTGWITYLNTLQFDHDRFVNEFDQAAEYIREPASKAESSWLSRSR